MYMRGAGVIDWLSVSLSLRLALLFSSFRIPSLISRLSWNFNLHIAFPLLNCGHKKGYNMDTRASYVHLPIADGTTMAAYTSFPVDAEGPVPGLIVIQEAFGVNKHMRDVCDRFAALGFATISPELFHRTAPEKFEGDYNDFASVMQHYQAVTLETIQVDLQATYKWLSEQKAVKADTVFSVGYCMGGYVAFVANAILPLKAAVSYYGGNTASVAEQMASQLHGRQLFFWGGKDKHIPQEKIDIVTNALDKAGKDYINVKFSDADHAFSCDARPSYNKAAADEALAMTLAFFKNNA
jgi:carboxymethylenebutenolidase